MVKTINKERLLDYLLSTSYGLKEVLGSIEPEKHSYHQGAHNALIVLHNLIVLGGLDE